MTDRSGERRRRQTSIVGAFVSITRELRESPAWCALSDQGRRLLDRIELEHLRHGGRENGNLVCTYDDFEQAGLRRKSVANAIRECEALGFLVTTRHGYRSAKTLRPPNAYRLTYLNGCGVSPAPTDDWKRVATPEEATALSAKARSAKAKADKPQHVRRIVSVAA